MELFIGTTCRKYRLDSYIDIKIIAHKIGVAVAPLSAAYVLQE